ncbi:MAG: shikimate dehydrogenase, partial [Gammaproteobacteria bacterium]|nr:shikimate dehydrogenase [Gammaproteobacteria bacterium]
MPDLYGVMGHPISHSKSPAIHGAFALQTGQDLEYRTIHVQPGDFTQAVTEFRNREGLGLNVTLPFKEEAWNLAGKLTSRAERARAVNTLWFGTNSAIHGDNTDGVGLVRDLNLNHGFRLERSRILVLGAGGAARGVLGPLLDEHPERLVIANRTESKATDLADAFSAAGRVSGHGFSQLAGEHFDLIINATSASLAGQAIPLPSELLKPEGVCYDMMYSIKPTVFMLWGQQQGALKSVDGLGMLVEQAAESFYRWRG